MENIQDRHPLALVLRQMNPVPVDTYAIFLYKEISFIPRSHKMPIPLRLSG
jgi:hypothetical protein